MKYGKGIEITVEGLVEMVKQRFPEIVDWDYLPGTPSVGFDHGRQVLELYWRETVDDIDLDAAPSLRLIGEGAPIPVIFITIDQVIDDSVPIHS